MIYIYGLPDDVFSNVASYADGTTLYSKCDQTFDLRQHLELASKLESDLPEIADWDRKWLVDFNAGKCQLVLFDQSIDVKLDRSVFEVKLSCRMLRESVSLLNWIGTFTLSPLLKLPPRTLEP